VSTMISACVWRCHDPRSDALADMADLTSLQVADERETRNPGSTTFGPQRFGGRACTATGHKRQMTVSVRVPLLGSAIALISAE
jgi:hypothetical protein